MSDILADIEEGFRQEKFNRLWKRWAPWIISAAVLLVVSVLGWVLWREAYVRAEEEATDRLYTISSSESSAQALTLLEGFDRQGSQLAIATLIAASRLRSEGRMDEASKQLADFLIKGEADPLLMGLIRLSWAWSKVESAASQAEIKTILEPELKGPYRWAAQEIIAWTELENGSYERARALLTALRDDEETPFGIRMRAKRLLLSFNEESDGVGYSDQDP